MELYVHPLIIFPDKVISCLLDPQGIRLAFVLEDGQRPEKIAGETCIPAGRYQIKPRREGKFCSEYQRRFKHKYALELVNVPNFQFILIHIGNTKADTRGCLLVGNGIDLAYNITGSTVTYQSLYNLISPALDRGEEVWITINRAA